MKSRPIIGHKGQFRQLSAILESGKVPQVMLFHGIPGIGKHRVARWFIRGLMCTGVQRPCGECPSCNQARSGSHPDIFELSPNEKGIIPIGKSDENGTVRWLIGRLAMTSVTGRYGIIINGVDHIPVQGQNALLKTLEEPPERAVIILLSSNRSLILPTILSRSTEFPFKSLTEEQISTIILDHGIEAPHIDLLSAFSGGSFELAVMLTEEDNLAAVIDILQSLLSYLQDGGMISLELDRIQKRIGPQNLLFVITNALRELLLVKLRNEEMPSLLAQLPDISVPEIQKLIKIMMELQKKLVFNINVTSMIKAFVYSMDNYPLVSFPDMPVEY